MKKIKCKHCKRLFVPAEVFKEKKCCDSWCEYQYNLKKKNAKTH